MNGLKFFNHDEKLRKDMCLVGRPPIASYMSMGLLVLVEGHINKHQGKLMTQIIRCLVFAWDYKVSIEMEN